MNGDSETPRSSASFRRLTLSNSFLIEAAVQLLVEKGFLERDAIVKLAEQLEKQANAEIRARD